MHCLIVEDQASQREAIAKAVSPVCHSVAVAQTLDEAREAFRRQPPDLIILDMNFPRSSEFGPQFMAIDFMQEMTAWVRERNVPTPKVFFETDHDISETNCEKVIALLDRREVSDVLFKPLHLRLFAQLVQRKALAVRQELELRPSATEISEAMSSIRVTAGTDPQETEVMLEDIVGESAAIKEVGEKILRFGPADATVLILGESGTGKELVARALHQNSARRSKPFVALNVGAVPESILESELFGHEAGAFTGAVARRIGKFEYAHGGTLFLDEVGEMPMEMQIKLLRVLEERKITRIGSNEQRLVNVRLVAATNANLKEAVEQGTFRRDLYYRLAVCDIHVPALRDRLEDIPLLIDHFLEQRGRAPEAIAPELRKRLELYPWPGNVRELKNAIEGMTAGRDTPVLDIEDIGNSVLADELRAVSPAAPREDLAARAAAKPLSTIEVVRALRQELSSLELAGSRQALLWKDLSDNELADCLSFLAKRTPLLNDAVGSLRCAIENRPKIRNVTRPADRHLLRIVLALLISSRHECYQIWLASISRGTSSANRSNIWADFMRVAQAALEPFPHVRITADMDGKARYCVLELPQAARIQLDAAVT